MSDSMEVVHRLEREMADRASAVEKVDIFKAQFNQAIKAFMAADEAIVHLSRHGATAVRLAGGADAVVTGIGNGAGIAVANLPCVTAARKELVANRGIFELLHFKP